MSPNPVEFGEITQNNGYCAVLDHSWLLLWPMESPHAISY